MSDKVIDAILRTPGLGRNGATVTDFPENPFKPGFGRNPAHRGARPEIESVLSGLLRMLRGGKPDTQAAFLYGPRGNGKTVLLQWLEEEAGRRPEGRAIIQVRISRTEMTDPVAVAETILDETGGFGDRIALSMEGRAGIPTLGSVRVAVAGKPRPLSLARVLSEKADPLLLTLDEAHEAPAEMLGGLLDVVQIAGRRRPIAAVFAGTPGLETKLLKAKASFWGRGEKLRVGLLSETSAREALARPFRDAGLEADDDAVEELAAAADNYPYFLQLYGGVAWSVVEVSGGRTLLPEHVAPTVVAADGARQDYYNDRYEEFYQIGLLPLARRVAEAFVESAATPADRSLPDAALEDILTDQDNAGVAREFLAAKGYVWRDRQGDYSWTPGIPSLMDYMIERVPAP